MLQHTEKAAISVGINDAWRFISDMANWAENMPGYQSYEMLNDTDSRWTLKVGVGALVKTVQVLVHIEEWHEPSRVRFSYRLENEPVDGHGHYEAERISDDEIDIALFVCVRGEGAMAPMWEAMAKPILPRLAHEFTRTLKALTEASVSGGAQGEPVRKVTLFAPLRSWLANIVGVNQGRSAS